MSKVKFLFVSLLLVALMGILMFCGSSTETTTSNNLENEVNEVENEVNEVENELNEIEDELNEIEDELNEIDG